MTGNQCIVILITNNSRPTMSYLILITNNSRPTRACHIGTNQTINLSCLCSKDTEEPFWIFQLTKRL